MELEVLNKEVERQARRVATAFDVTEFQIRPHENQEEQNHRYMQGMTNQSPRARVIWIIDLLTEKWIYLRIVGPIGYVSVFSVNNPSTARFYLPTAELMALGLYLLGVEEQEALSQIFSLSAHEKLELRLSLPREFWPQTWLDEEDANY